eukprot:3193103-Pleurochrysis_carterae.AAC.1
MGCSKEAAEELSTKTTERALQAVGDELEDLRRRWEAIKDADDELTMAEAEEKIGLMSVCTIRCCWRAGSDATFEGGMGLVERVGNGAFTPDRHCQ